MFGGNKMNSPPNRDLLKQIRSKIEIQAASFQVVNNIHR